MWIRQLPEPLKIEIEGFLGRMSITSTLKTELGPVLRLLLKGAAQGVKTGELVEVTELSEGVIREQADWLIRRGMLEEIGDDFTLTLIGERLYERLIVSERLDSGGWNIFFDIEHERVMFENQLESSTESRRKITPSLYQRENPFNTFDLIQSTMPPEEVMNQLEAEQLVLKLEFQRDATPKVRPFLLRAVPTYFEEVVDTSLLLETSSTISDGPFFELHYPINSIRLKEPSVLLDIQENDWEHLERFRKERPNWLSEEALLLFEQRDTYEKYRRISMYTDEVTGSFSVHAPPTGLGDGIRVQGTDRSSELLRRFETKLAEEGYDTEMLEVEYDSFHAVKRIPVSWLEEQGEQEVEHEIRS